MGVGFGAVFLSVRFRFSHARLVGLSYSIYQEHRLINEAILRKLTKNRIIMAFPRLQLYDLAI